MTEGSNGKVKTVAEISRALNTAAQARLTLAGKRKGEGFWIMPEGAHFVRECWKQNMALARKMRKAMMGGVS